MTLNLTGSPPNTAAMVNSAVNTELSSNWFPLAGVTNGGNASAGNIGEYISSQTTSGSAVSLSNGTNADVTSISLTAGDWDVWGSISYTLSAAATVVQTWINTVSATYPTSVNGGAYFVFNLSGETGFSSGTIVPAGMKRISISSTTTVYLSTLISFTGTAAANGFIGARRVR